VELRRVTVKVPVGEAARAASLTATASTVIAPGVKVLLSRLEVLIAVEAASESSSAVASQTDHVPEAVKFPVADERSVAISHHLSRG
jgi:hypothetical protein